MTGKNVNISAHGNHFTGIVLNNALYEAGISLLAKEWASDYGAGGKPNLNVDCGKGKNVFIPWTAVNYVEILQ